MATRWKLRQAVDDGASANDKVASHADLETAMQVGIRGAGRGDDPADPDALLDPDAIALTYLNILRQPRSAWTSEIELRHWVERF